MTPEQTVIFMVLLLMAVMVFLAARNVTPAMPQIDEKVKKRKGVTYQFRELDWAILLSNEMQSYLPDNKIDAIKLYREITRATLKEAYEAIEYFIANPEDVPARLRHSDDVQGQISRMREFLRQGKRDDARAMYQRLTGADEFEVRGALNQLEDEAQIEQERFERLRSIVDE